MPSATSALRSGRLSVASVEGATQSRSPGVISAAFRAQSPGLRFASLMDMDFAVRWPLVRRSRLIPGSCPSTRTFALRFFRTPSRDGSPCVLLTLPSRPGEFHPEPPTDPDVNLSIHPARATQRRLPPSIRIRSSSGFPLTPPDASDLLPLLGGHYPASSLLRSSAPLIGASVLSASWVLHLCFFPLHHRPGSQVPYESPDKSHAA